MSPRREQECAALLPFEQLSCIFPSLKTAGISARLLVRPFARRYAHLYLFDVVGHHRASFKHTLQHWCWTDKVWWVWRKYSRHGAAEDEERLECCGLNKKTLTIWANGQQLKQVRAGCDSLRPYVRKLREKLGSQNIIERNGEGAKVLTLNMSPSLLSGVTTCNIFIFTTRITPAVVYRAGQCNHKFVLSWIQNKIVQFSKATQCL